MIGQELLRRAYPNGLLVMRGVRTWCGWTCLFADPNSYGGDHQAVGFYHAGEECRLTCWPDGRVIPCSVERHGHPLPLESLEKMLREGDLLPDVDPEDVATWVCCLTDLAAACLVGVDPPTNVHPHRFWVRGWHPAMVPLIPNPRPEVAADWTGGWVLDIAWGTTEIVVTSFPFVLNAGDPALALVLARIQLREKEGR